MKFNFFKLIFTSAFVLAAGTAFAQEYGPEWGENATPEERKQNVLNYNYYTDAYNQQRYDDALGYLPQLIKDAPKGRQSLYVYAINIYDMKIQRSRDRDERNRYIDSLFILYDLRLEHFGDAPKNGRDDILVKKANHYLALRPGDLEGIEEVFEAAIAANAANPDPDFINRYFKKLTDEFLADAIETDEYIETYDRLSGIMNGITDPAADAAKSTFDALFIQSKAADCDSIERIFGERLAANPDNVEDLLKAFGQMSRLNCHSAFFFNVAERLLRLQPTADIAIITAKAYEAAGNTAKALEFLRAAVENETDPLLKSNLCVEISGTELNAGKAQSAASFAKQALEYNPENGFAYMFLAQAYSTGSTQCEGFDRQVVYWLAYDLAQQARRVAAGTPEESRAVELMNQYRTAFPSNDDLFFRGLETGAPYQVKCGWISASTTVKQGEK